jgi:hypothetical protein
MQSNGEMIIEKEGLKYSKDICLNTTFSTRNPETVLIFNQIFCNNKLASNFINYGSVVCSVALKIVLSCGL